jgi:tetratricopeptide (TPR) repeat protein
VESVVRKLLVGIVVVIIVAGLAAWYYWPREGRPGPVPPAPRAHNDAPYRLQPPGDIASSGFASTGPVPSANKAVHPLLHEAAEAILAEGNHEVPSTASPALREVMRAAAPSGQDLGAVAALTIDYPLDQAVFPPEIVPPTILWHDRAERADTWLLELAFGDGGGRLYVLLPGDRPPDGPIDPRCVTATNEVYRGTAYQASAKAWKVDPRVWTAFKRHSVERPATLAIRGFQSNQPGEILSRGQITIATSKDPVGAPIFYRDVPLAPSDTQEGVIKPLSEAFLPLIAWRLRDISQPQSRLLLSEMLTCANCHSFSDDGKTLGMDLDGPAGDKGAYVIAPVAPQTVIEQKHVITWNAYDGKPKGHKTIGFLSRLSPDGQYAVTTLNEAVYVQNFTDYRFLQVFYPTRGILGYYDRATGQIRALPGANDPKYVHCDPVWTPDGKHLIFARAEAKDAYPAGYRPAARPNDPAETPIQYDLYRMPFDGGRGGRPEPIAGASQNGMSNTFPKVSPDGKWIVFVKCRNGQLLRPDSELWIVPAQGGNARRMRANTPRMNSWHSFSPNGRWLVFSSKANTPYTQMFLTHLDEDGNDTPAVLIPDSTAANRAVNLPEFVNVAYDEFAGIRVPAVQYLRDGMRGIQLFEQGKLDEAMAQFEAAVTRQPDYLEGHVSMAVILIEKGRLDEAIPRLERALALDPNCWFAHANLGLVRQRQGRPLEAIGHFRKAVELQPKHLIARTNLARALAEQGQLDEAAIHFRAAVQLAPKDAPSRANLGNVLLEKGLLDEAVEQYEKALEIDPRCTVARLGLAEALARRGEFPSAVDQFRKAQSAEPNDPGAANGLAWLLATCPDDRVRDGREALAMAEKACAATGQKDPVCLRTLAAAYAEAGRWSEAVATATRALKLAEPHSATLAEEIRQHLGRYRQGQPVRWEKR